ncbi:hypothetical protein DR864_28165 [Runella rosea]|uniref:Uncharacterized protein n=1 Tax=Runella rosea TaxID=2259595 RepID=A0A344TCA1_9BACT|nr:hypothetical protein DR864_00295 [Runella rosea]AXE21340.1 hypothetical protein DR864_28165 [Runella rosea]
MAKNAVMSAAFFMLLPKFYVLNMKILEKFRKIFSAKMGVYPAIIRIAHGFASILLPVPFKSL